MRVLRPTGLVLVGLTSAIGVLTIAALAYLSCSMVGRDVVTTRRTPDGAYKAVLVEINAGATTSFAYEVYIEPAESESQTHKVAYLYGAIRSADAYGANLRWSANRSLEVEYFRANRTKDVISPLAIEGEAFHVHLAGGVVDPSAPPGGMLRNLELCKGKDSH